MPVSKAELAELRKQEQAALKRLDALIEGRAAAAQSAASKPNIYLVKILTAGWLNVGERGGASTSDVSSTTSSSPGRSKFVDDMIGGATTAANSALLGVDNGLLKSFVGSAMNTTNSLLLGILYCYRWDQTLPQIQT